MTFDAKTATERRQHAEGRRDGFHNEAMANHKPAYKAGWREGMLERMSMTSRDRAKAGVIKELESWGFVMEEPDQAENLASNIVDEVLSHDE